MTTLYHATQSCSTRILGLLEELRLPYRVEYVTINTGPALQNGIAKDRG
jgi:glutathione S-transferase